MASEQMHLQTLPQSVALLADVALERTEACFDLRLTHRSGYAAFGKHGMHQHQMHYQTVAGGKLGGTQVASLCAETEFRVLFFLDIVNLLHVLPPAARGSVRLVAQQALVRTFRLLVDVLHVVIPHHVLQERLSGCVSERTDLAHEVELAKIPRLLRRHSDAMHLLQVN